MDFYRLLKLFGKLKSPKARLLGLYVMHTARRRYIGIYLDPVLSCNFRCKMCYFSDEEKRKEMHGILSEQDMETIAKALFHRALKLQIGCGAEPSLYKNLTGIVRLGKQYNVPYISLTTNGNLLTKEQLFSMAEAGLDEITLSTHGIRKETYEHLMTNGKYDLFLQLLDNLKEVKKQYPDFRIRINYTMNEDNTEELKDFWKVFGDIPLNILQLRPVQEIGNSEYQNFSLQKISELLDSVVNPLVEECKRKGIICMAPEHKNLQILEQETPDKDKTFEELTYCYVSARSCWNEDFDLHTETFESYCRRKRMGKYILQKLFSRTENKLDKPKHVTRKMNYSVK